LPLSQRRPDALVLAAQPKPNDTKKAQKNRPSTKTPA
jgi:hypothetical protein